MPSDPPRLPTPTSKIPKSINRELRSHAQKLEDYKRGLQVLRTEIVEDIEEHEQILAALKGQLREIDRTLHTVPSE